MARVDPVAKAQYSAEYYERNKEKMRAYQKDYRQTKTEKYLLAAAKGRSKYRGIPFDIDVSDIVIPEFCPVLGLKLERGSRGFNDSAPSVDKTRPHLGYVKGNVEVMSYRANKAKCDLSLEELVMLGKWAEEKLNGN